MAAPGWYPDPEGAPGRYRYWDGTRWAAEAVDGPPPGAQQQLPLPGRPARLRRGRLLAAGLIVIIAAAVILVLSVVRPDRGAVRDLHPPTTPVSGWNDSSPSATPSTERSATPRVRPTPVPSPRPAAHCPTGEPLQTVRHRPDKRVHGGQLSFARVRSAGFGSPRRDDHYRWWYDEHSQSTAAGAGGRTARLAVGAVAIQDGFRTVRQAAVSSLRCVIGGPEYAGYTGSHTVRDRKLTVDEAAGRELITEVHTTAGGDRIRLIVVDAGAPGSYSIFVGVSPLGDHGRAAIVDDAVAGLRVGP